MKHKYKYSLLFLLVLIISCGNISVKANINYLPNMTKSNYKLIPVDFGDYNDYDSGWDSSSDWDSDWSDSSYDYDDGYYSSSSDMSLTDYLISVVVVAVILLISFIRSKTSNKNRKASMNKNTQHTNLGAGSKPWLKLTNKTPQIEAIIKEHDPNFSSDGLLTFAKNSFVEIQYAWSNGDLKPVIGLLNTPLYQQTNSQLSSMKSRGIKNVIESVAVNTTYLSGYTKDNEFEHVTLYLNAKMIDYQININTNKIIKGDTSTRWDMYYKIKLTRSLKVSTTKAKGDHSHACPCCGAPLTVSAQGICEYCGSFITSGMYDWVISEIGTIRQDTIDEGIRI